MERAPHGDGGAIRPRVCGQLRARRPPHRPLQRPLGHLWSLAQEEQFYLLWPPLLLALLAVGRRRTAALVVAVVLAGAELHLLDVARSGHYIRVYFAPDTHLVPLVAGCLVAFVPRRVRVGSGVAWLSLLVFACVSLYAVSTLRDFVWAEPVETLASVGIVAGAVGGGAFARALAFRPLAGLGRISYSLYLWHYPLLVLLQGEPTLALALSLPAAYLSYRFVERPFRAARARERVRPGVPGLTYV